MGKAHFNIGSIQGGTHAGWRKVVKTEAWTCKCGPQPRYMNNCLECGARRP